MNCSDRDQDLLLLEHGKLTGLKRWSTELHVRNCPRCQERQEQFSVVSRQIAGAFRQDGLPPRIFTETERAALRERERPLQPVVARVSGVRAVPQNPPYRPAFLAMVTGLAAMIAASAHVYRAMALTPTMQLEEIAAARPLPKHIRQGPMTRTMRPSLPRAAVSIDHSCSQ